MSPGALALPALHETCNEPPDGPLRRSHSVTLRRAVRGALGKEQSPSGTPQGFTGLLGAVALGRAGDDRSPVLVLVAAFVATLAVAAILFGVRKFIEGFRAKGLSRVESTTIPGAVRGPVKLKRILEEEEED